jgi:hypothetical protein
MLDKLSAAPIWRDGKGYPYPRLSVTGLTYGSLPATLTANSAYAAPPYILMTQA